ncbi:MAG: hypothetical protein PQJ60_01865 [Spirochaetales bacterium]|nr:hypothetical protein [Spirochaetales bacterium]
MEAESVLVSIKKTGSFPTEEKIFDKSSELFFVVLEIVKEVEFGPKKEAKSYDSRIIIEFYEDTPFATYSLEIFDDGSHVIPIQFYKGKAEQSNSKGWFYFYDQKSLISKLKSAFE